MLDILLNYVKIVNPKIYSRYMAEAQNLIDDQADSPFLACAMALNAGIWSDDKHFQKQKKIKMYTTKELLKTL